LFQLIQKGEKIMVVNFYKSKILEQPNIKYDVLMETLSNETGYELNSIKNTVSEYSLTGKYESPSKKKKSTSINDTFDDFIKNSIRQKIHTFWIKRKIPSFHKILKAIKCDPDLPNISQASLKRSLKELNFEYFNTKNQKLGLIEGEDIVLWRRKYIRDIRRYRSESRTIYYLDELSVYVDDCTSNDWIDAKVKCQTNSFLLENSTDKEKFLIVVHIASIEGFVEGGLFCFKSTKNEIKDETFYEWFCEVLPRLNDNCIIVMDNASYHSAKMNRIPTMDWKKKNIIKWLVSKNCAVDNQMVKCQLMEMVDQVSPVYDKYLIDEEALKTNKAVLRFPPYHNQLNPFDSAWPLVINHVKQNNTTGKLTDVQKLLIDGVQRITPDMWTDFISRTIKEEDKLYDLEFITDEILDEASDVTRDISDISD